MTRIAVLHPGEMGTGIGTVLRASGHEVCWLPAGRGPETAERAAAAGFTPIEDLAGCEIVFSVCPPSAAVDLARRASGFTGVFVDANAISPATAREVAATVSAGGASYVDGGIIGGPPNRSPGTRLYLSGDRAGEVAALVTDPRLAVRVLHDGDPATAASTLKMCYAGWTKISAALLLAIAQTADATGVAEALRTEWEQSLPDLAGRLTDAERSALAKGWRWAGEMREIAQTFASTDAPAGFGEAAAQLYERYRRPGR